MTGFDAPFTHVRTLHDVWESALERHAKEKCLGTRGGEPTSAPGAYAFNTFEDVGRLNDGMNVEEHRVRVGCVYLRHPRTRVFSALVLA